MLHPPLSGRDVSGSINARNAGYAGLKVERAGAVSVALQIIRHNFLRYIWHDRCLPKSDFWTRSVRSTATTKIGRGSDSRCFVIKDATRLAPKELIHRHANPARMIHLRSKGFVERILNRLCGPFNHRDRKTLSGKLRLSPPQPNFVKSRVSWAHSWKPTSHKRCQRCH